jgi:hypothetical protein
MSDKPAVEVVMFRLKSGVSEPDFLEANRAVQADLQKASGYIRRELSRNDDGQWFDLVYWNSLTEAQQALEAFSTWPSTQRIAPMIDESSITMLHVHPIATFN